MTDNKAFDRFKHRLKNQYGLDLDLYKETQINRRLQGYIVKYKLDGFDGLFEYIASTPQGTHLIDYLDINVSEFYRNPELFAFLEQEVLAKQRNRESALRIWSAGCSIGAEPYSLAIATAEAKLNHPPFIWATDLDAGALAHAAAGKYTMSDVKNVTEARLRTHFDVAGEAVAVKKALKARIEFAKHDLLRDPIKGKFDLIACRNVAIYFTEDAKTAMLKRFATALSPQGVLFTGATESYMNYRDFGFTRINSCFYQKAGE